MSHHCIPLRCFCWIGLSLFMACHTPVRRQPPEILAYFKLSSLRDTTHIEIADESVEIFDTIPNRLFFTEIPARLLQQIDYLADSASAVVLSRQSFPMDDSITAYWVEIRQFWFQHQSLFLYNHFNRQFTDRITMAEWYGGDGGQVLIGSWMFDYDGDGKKDIVRRTIEHSMIPGEEEPKEQVFESASLLRWKKGRFEDALFPDTPALVRQFPIETFW